MTRLLLFAALLLAGWAAARRCPAQPTLVSERTEPAYYQTYDVFALPGHRYLHCGLYETHQTQPVYGPMLAVTKQNGDTVRYQRIMTHPPGPYYIFLPGISQEPDYSLFLAAEYSPVTPTAMDQDSLLLLRVDTLGRIRWRRAYPLTSTPARLLRTADGYLLCTNRNAFPTSTNPVYYPTPNITKFDLAGNIVWEKSMGTRGYGGVGEVNDIVACPDGSYLAFGNTDDGTPYLPGASTNGRLDYFAVKFTSAGDTLRTFHFGVPGVDEYGQRLRSTVGGGWAVTGFRLRPGASGIPPQDGQFFKLDSLFHSQWSQTQAWTGSIEYNWYYQLLQPLSNGDVLTGGNTMYTLPAYPRVGGEGQLTCYQANGAVRWDFQRQYQNYNGTGFRTMVNHADGSALLTGATSTGTAASNYQFYSYSVYLTNVGVPYVPDLCQHPPMAQLGYTTPTPDSLRTIDFSAPGPRYGVISLWDWDYGDGSPHGHAAQARHRYATPPGPGTAVRLTVTNNLGCTSSIVEYPWGPLSTAQQMRALAAGATLYPNPALASATLSVPGLCAQAPLAGTVTDGLGRVVLRFTAPVQAGTATAGLDMSSLPAGVYAVSLATAEGPVVKRLVKQ